MVKGFGFAMPPQTPWKRVESPCFSSAGKDPPDVAVSGGVKQTGLLNSQLLMRKFWGWDS